MLYTGLDYHRSFSYITTMNEKGKVIGQKKLPSNGEIVNFLKEFGERMEVAIEATPSWLTGYGSYGIPNVSNHIRASYRKLEVEPNLSWSYLPRKRLDWRVYLR